MDRRTIREDG
jgi:hypothetical protein